MRDLSHKSGVTPNRLNSFERGQIHLRPDENKNIYSVFKEEGIIFYEFGEVALDPSKADRKDQEEVQTEHLNHAYRQDERYQVDEEEYRRLTGLDALSSKLEQHASINKKNSNALA